MPFLHCLQKIRTIDLDGKTIKLQIVSCRPSYDAVCKKGIVLLICNHFHFLSVGYCRTGTVPHDNVVILSRGTWYHRGVRLYRSRFVRKREAMAGGNRALRLRQCKQTASGQQV